jgi:hypothetical protein
MAQIEGSWRSRDRRSCASQLVAEARDLLRALRAAGMPTACRIVCYSPGSRRWMIPALPNRQGVRPARDIAA